jgi:hypothetical protein
LFLVVTGVDGVGFLAAHAQFGLAIGEAMQLHALPVASTVSDLFSAAL